jgi:hypothetical protein
MKPIVDDILTLGGVGRYQGLRGRIARRTSLVAI